MTHEVVVLCGCDDIEHCRMELYVSDVRIAVDELDRLRQTAEACSDPRHRMARH